MSTNWPGGSLKICGLAGLVTCWFSACGYSFVGRSAAEGKQAVTIPIAKNETAFAGLTGPLTEALRQRAAMSGLNVLDRDPKAPRLEVTIVKIASEPGVLVAKEKRLLPVDAVWHIEATAQLVAAGGQLLRGPYTYSADGRSYAGGSILEEEALASRQRISLLDDLAASIVSELVESE